MQMEIFMKIQNMIKMVTLVTHRYSLQSPSFTFTACFILDIGFLNNNSMLTIFTGTSLVCNIKCKNVQHFGKTRAINMMH